MISSLDDISLAYGNYLEKKGETLQFDERIDDLVSQMYNDETDLYYTTKEIESNTLRMKLINNEKFSKEVRESDSEEEVEFPEDGPTNGEFSDEFFEKLVEMDEHLNANIEGMKPSRVAKRLKEISDFENEEMKKMDQHGTSLHGRYLPGYRHYENFEHF